MQIFTKEAMDATEFLIKKKNMIYTHICCGKVNIIFEKRNITGYILDESRGKQKILLANNKIIYKPPLDYNRDSNKYIYKSGGKYVISFYWLIQILLRKKWKRYKNHIEQSCLH